MNQAAAAVTTAQAALAAGSAPATPEAVAGTEAAIQQDQAAIAADQAKLAEAVVVAPFDGVVSAVNGTVGEVVSDQGVQQPTAPAALSQGQTTGIQLFPQGPQSGSSTSSPDYAALITLDSVQNQMVVQVPETSIDQIHVGQKASATLPAVSGSVLSVQVSQIERTPVVLSGQTYFRVDLVTTSKGAHTLAYSANVPSLASIPTPGQTGRVHRRRLVLIRGRPVRRRGRAEGVRPGPPGTGRCPMTAVITPVSCGGPVPKRGQAAFG